jgi:hypothetical protein
MWRNKTHLRCNDIQRCVDQQKRGCVHSNGNIRQRSAEDKRLVLVGLPFATGADMSSVATQKDTVLKRSMSATTNAESWSASLAAHCLWRSSRGVIRTNMSCSSKVSWRATSRGWMSTKRRISPRASDFGMLPREANSDFPSCTRERERARARARAMARKLSQQGVEC